MCTHGVVQLLVRTRPGVVASKVHMARLHRLRVVRHIVALLNVVCI